MSDLHVTVTPDDQHNAYIVKVVRHLNHQESEELRQLLWDAYNDGWHDHRVELERQAQDPMYAITDRNPYRRPERDA